MWTPGNCHPGNHLESTQPVLSQRKRSIDLIRQAHFAACSYLGFDPYEEKHKNNLVHHQVAASDGSIPVELHLHHHHHHHCRENEELLKRPSHLSASADSPLGVGSLLSICDHIQTFQDAWQGHTKVEERGAQKIMLHGSLIKRDSTFTGFEGALPVLNDRKDKPRERLFPSRSERYWNGGAMATAPAIVPGSDNHHINTAARISHWECSVVQEEKLTKGIGIRIGQCDGGRPMLMSNGAIDYTTNNDNVAPHANHNSSNHIEPMSSGLKLEHMSHSGGASVPSSSQESFTGSTRKFGSAVTKRKKSISDIEVGNDHAFAGFSETSVRPAVDTESIHHSSQLPTMFGNAKKLPGSEVQMPRNSTSEGSESGKPSFQTLPSFIGKVEGSPHKQRGLSNCNECSCQQALPALRPPLSSKGKEGFGGQLSLHGSVKERADGFDVSNPVSKQYDFGEKIIILDESENGDVHSPQFVRHHLLMKPSPVSIERDERFLAASSTKVLEDYNGNAVWDEKRDKGGRNVKNANDGDNLTPKTEQDMWQNSMVAKVAQEPGSFPRNDRTTEAVNKDVQVLGHNKSKRDLLAWKSMQDGESQIQIKEENMLNRGCDGIFTWQQVHSKTVSPSMNPQKHAHVDPRQDARVDKSMELEQDMMENTNKNIVTRRSEPIFQTGESGSFVLDTLTLKSDSEPKECLFEGTLRVHQQVEFEKLRHESSKKLEQAQKEFDKLLKDLGTSKSVHGHNVDGDGFSKMFAFLQERERRNLTQEFDARRATEEKDAESRLLQLLEERMKLHLKFDEELEQKEAERMRLHSLFEEERLKSEAAKKELQDLKEKFASLLMRATPMSPRIKCDEISVTPRTLLRLSDAIEKHKPFAKREDQSMLSLCEDILEGAHAENKPERVEDGKPFMTDRSPLLKNSSREACILQEVRQQETQLKTAEAAFNELERKLKHVEHDRVSKESSKAAESGPRAVKLIERSTQTSNWSDGMYEKYSCVYQSPIFEHSITTTHGGNARSLEETSETDSEGRASSGMEHSEDPTDQEIRQLTEELKTIGADMLSHKLSESNGNGFTHMGELNHVESYHEKQMREGEFVNRMLQRKLKDKNAQINKMIAQHAKELQKLQSSSSQAHQVNKQLASNLANSEAKLSELQTHYDGLLATVEGQLKEVQDSMKDLENNTDKLREALSESEKRAVELKKYADQKETELEELRIVQHKLQREKDALEKDKLDLSGKLQEARLEVNEQTSRVAEYLSINEELLEFAQRKENEVASLSQQAQALQQQNLDWEKENEKLRTDLESARKELNEVQKAYNSIDAENNLLKSKLSDSNLQMFQHEGTIATLTKQMADIMQGRDSMLEEAAQFHGYLQSAKYKEFELESKLVQSATHMKDLEEKLKSMESETVKARLELADLKKQNASLQKSAEDKDQEASGMRKSVIELRKKVQDLEEEVMLKEGQIAIISSQNRESYEPF